MCADVSVIVSSYLLYYKNGNKYDNSYQYLNKKSGCKKIFCRSEDCLGSAFHITEDEFMNQVLKHADFGEFVHTVIEVDLRHYGHAHRCYGIHAHIKGMLGSSEWSRWVAQHYKFVRETNVKEMRWSFEILQQQSVSPAVPKTTDDLINFPVP